MKVAIHFPANFHLPASRVRIVDGDVVLEQSLHEFLDANEDAFTDPFVVLEMIDAFINRGVYQIDQGNGAFCEVHLIEWGAK